VVVASADLIEDGARELDAERLPCVLVDHDVAFEAAATDFERDVRLVCLELIADDVAHSLAVHAEELVAGEESRMRRG
jgi:hypothetical protein